MSHYRTEIAALLAIVLIGGCGGSGTDPEPPANDRQPTVPLNAAGPSAISIPLASKRDTQSPAAQPQFRDVAPELGIDFDYHSDTVPGRYWLPEIMGSGAAWLDFDGDGQLDLYLANGAALDESRPADDPPCNRLYQQRDGRFVDSSLTANAKHFGYGQGVAAGDFDADGFTDLYIANWRDNCLLHNNGDGTFDEITATAGVVSDVWSTSVVWFDVNRDGLLDLYVANYLNLDLNDSELCDYNGQRGYCGPGQYDGLPDDVYLNRGDGTFQESAVELGLTGSEAKGLAVSVLDLDNDLLPEIYVANDMARNFLFTRTATEASVAADTPWQEVAMQTGCGLSDDGRNEASMGIATADYDGDGQIDLFLTHYFQAKNTLYRNLGSLMFDDDSRRWKVATTSHNYLGFGIVPLDWDRDGRPEVFIANGHVLGPKNDPNQMTQQLLWNSGRVFLDVSRQAGSYFEELCLGRGAALADFDFDGDSDVLVTHVDRPAALLRNETPAAGHFLGLDLRTSNRIPAVGGRVVIEFADRQTVVPVTAGGSYLTSGDSRLLIGLGLGPEACRLTVYWPDGREDQFDDLAVDRYWRVVASPDGPTQCLAIDTSGS